MKKNKNRNESNYQLINEWEKLCEQGKKLQPYSKFWKEIEKAKRITLVTHLAPDGDTICSTIALKEMIVKNTNKKCKDVKISGIAAPRFLECISENEIVDASFFNDSLVVVVDANDASRTSDARVISAEAVKIDHHPITPGKWVVQIGGDFWIATGQLLYEMSQILGLKLTKKAKEMIFTAIWTDSDGMTALHKMPKELESIIETLNVDTKKLISRVSLLPSEQKRVDALLKDVKVEKHVGYLLMDSPLSNDIGRQVVAQFGNKFDTKVFCTLSPSSNDSNFFFVQFRSRGDFDVQKLALAFGGNGHWFASGCGIRGDYEVAKKTIASIIDFVELHV